MQTEATLTLPLPLAEVANRIASEQHWSFPEAVTFLVKRGVEAQQESERAVEASHQRFIDAETPEEQAKAGNDMIRTIFGPDSVA
jgi:hypothetical protein